MIIVRGDKKGSNKSGEIKKQNREKKLNNLTEIAPDTHTKKKKINVYNVQGGRDAGVAIPRLKGAKYPFQSYSGKLRVPASLQFIDAWRGPR